MDRNPNAVPLDALLAHRDFVRSLARSLVIDENRADDLVQDTWLQALLRPPHAATSIRGWLATVVLNFARRGRRDDGRRLDKERTAAREDRLPSTEEIVEREVVRRQAVDAVLALSEPYRSALLLRFYEDLPPREIARRLDVPVETVKTRIKRGLEQVRERLDRAHRGDRDAWCRALAPFALLRPTRLAPTPSTAAALATVIGLVVLPLIVRPGASRAGRASVPAPATTIAAAPSPVEAVSPEPPRALRSGAPGASLPHVTGRVQDRSGRAVPGARIVSYPDFLRRPVTSGEENEHARTAVAGADGRFLVTLAGSAPSFELLVDAAGLSPCAVFPVRAGDDRTVTLEPPRRLAGSVRDRGGAPVAGASVRWLGLLSGGRVERSTRCDDGGAFRLTDLPVSGEAEGWLEVSAPGFAPLLIADPAEDPVELVLLRGITVSGRVRDAESRAPLPGARVVLWWVEGRPGLRRPGGLVLENPWSPRPLGEAVAGEGGAFRFESVPALGFHETVTEVHGRSGRVIAGLGALRAGHATMVAEVPLLEDGASWEIDLLLWPAGRLRGRVFEPSGRPAAGAEIAAAGSGRPEQGELPLLYQGVPRSFGRTGPDGTYELESVPVPSGHAVQVRVRARLPGSDDHAVVEVPLRAGETAAVPDLVAPAPARAVLRVVDEADRPIWGAYPGYQVTDPLIDEQRTGPDGRLTLRFPRLASPSERQRMFVHAPGFAPSRTPEFLPSVHAPPEVRVVLGPARRIAGRVLQADGTPATGASLVVTDPDVPVEDALTIPQSWGRKPGVPLLLIHGRATVAHDGTFEVRDLSAGPFHVVASLGGARGALLRVPTGSDALVLVLPPAPPPPPTAAVEGSVLDAETGLPLLDFRVGIEDGTRLLGARRVRPGRFRIERAPLGTWTLRAAASGYLPAVRPGVVVERGGALEPLVVALERGTKVHGMIRAAPGLDLAGAVVVFVGDGGPDQAPSARIGGNGAYEASGFLPGRYRPVIWNGPEPPFAAPETPEVLVVPEQAADVEFDVRAVRAGALSVLVHGGPAPGRRDDGVRIEVRDARGRLVREWRGIDGDFAPTFAVPPGAYAIRFQGPGAAEGQKLVTVEEGRSAAVTLRLE